MEPLKHFVLPLIKKSRRFKIEANDKISTRRMENRNRKMSKIMVNLHIFITQIGSNLVLKVDIKSRIQD